ncbi:hypothetical protein ACFY1U_33290 [Streptomyces sp. NPDC001351]|uniref:hypothetical protein n=1 Tax=Streptomyces sp. NPDC001351 TaxID=3364564 RepID=UPI00368F007E
MSGTDCPCADIITTIARRSRTASFAVLLIRCSRRPSSMLTGRTNTPDDVPRPPPPSQRGSSLPRNERKINDPTKDPSQATGKLKQPRDSLVNVVGEAAVLRATL